MKFTWPSVFGYPSIQAPSSLASCFLIRTPNSALTNSSRTLVPSAAHLLISSVSSAPGFSAMKSFRRHCMLICLSLNFSAMSFETLDLPEAVINQEFTGRTCDQYVDSSPRPHVCWGERLQELCEVKLYSSINDLFPAVHFQDDVTIHFLHLFQVLLVLLEQFVCTFHSIGGFGELVSKFSSEVSHQSIARVIHNEDFVRIDVSFPQHVYLSECFGKPKQQSVLVKSSESRDESVQHRRDD